MSTASRAFRAAFVAAWVASTGVAPVAAGIVPGGGPASSDCYVVLDIAGVESASVQKGKRITCTDGDPCDSGACGDGRCTFRTAVCVNQSGVAGCTPPASLQQVRLRGKVALPVPSQLGGAVCASPADVVVETKTKKNRRKPGKVRFGLLAKAPKGTKPGTDVDNLQLVCAPRTTDCPGSPSNVVRHPGGTLTAPETWNAATHVLEGSLSVESSLTVAACSVIRMPIGGQISVRNGGSLKLLGRPDCPITVTTGKSVGSPGDWTSIEFYDTSTGPENILQHVVVEYGGDATYGALWIDGGASVEISNTTFRNLQTSGVRAERGARLRNFVGNAFRAIQGLPMDLDITVAGDLQPATFENNQEQAIALRGGTLDRNATWRNVGVPYLLGSLSIQGTGGSATLTVEAGTTLKLQPRADIQVRTSGALALAGTAEAPVTITSAKSTPARGDWQEIEFYAGSVAANNVIRHAVVEYGGGDSYGLVWLQNGASVAISDSTFRQSSDVGIKVEGDTAKLVGFTGNTLVENARGAISLRAGLVADLGPGTYGPNDIDGIVVNGGTVTRNATWNNLGTRYLVTGSNFEVNGTGETAVLTVAAGTTIAMDQGRSIVVRSNGRLDLAGTSGNRVTITSDEASPTPGSWVEIDLYSAGNSWRFADVRYGSPSTSSDGQVWMGSGAGLSVNNVVFSNSGNGCDVYRSVGTTFTTTTSTFTPCGPGAS